MCTSTSDGGLFDDYKQTGCKMIDLGWKSRFDFSVVYKLRQVLKEEKPDIIFITEAQNLVYYRLAILFSRFTTIQIGSFRGLTFWLGHEKLLYKYFDNLLARLLYRTSKFVIVNSSELNKHYSQVVSATSSNPIHVICNGCEFDYTITKNPYDIKKELHFDNHDFIVIMVARLDPWKDFNTLLKAASIVIEKNVAIKFILLGDGSIRSQIFTMILEMNLENNVFLLGEKKDVINYINASDISVLSTHGEGFSNSLMESMGLEKPVIATDVGGNSSVIGVSGDSGILVPPNSPQIFAEAIELLVNDSQKRKNLGKKGKDRIYSICGIDNYISEYQKLFDAALYID
jgi:glycosyltransferase involved in cell wall biosynthesis